ncbi:MAG: ribokinase [Actinomycetia bacterium]|nr:ribokinase [Actinomycetes bacterium]
MEGADNPAQIRSRPGGSAANQAAWMGHLGLDVAFAGRVGEADAELHQAELARFGVHTQLAADEAVGTGSVVVLVGADGERTMITDRGANLRLVASDVPFGLLDGVALLHLTGYTLVDPGPRPVALGLIAQARRRGVPVSVDPGSSAFLARLEPGEFVRWTEGAAVCFPNRDEAAVLTGETDPAQMAISLSAHYGAVAVKLAADGAVLAARGAGAGAGARGHPPQRFPALPAVVRDTTGAGDAFCAGFLAAWLAGAGLAGAMGAAAQAAAVAVAALGGRPEPGQRTVTRVPRSVAG